MVVVVRTGETPRQGNDLQESGRDGLRRGDTPATARRIWVPDPHERLGDKAAADHPTHGFPTSHRLRETPPETGEPDAPNGARPVRGERL